MTFQVPPSKASKGQDKFPFKIGSQAFSVKKAKFLTIGEQIAIADGSTAVSIDLVFGEAGTKIGDAVRGLDDDQFGALMDAYNEDSGVTPGESEGSSTSSGSTESPSSST